MKALVIAIFLLLPFALSAVMPQVVVHAHQAADTDGHEGHHHPDADSSGNEKQSGKSLKSHLHDGQAHEFVKADRFIPRMAFSGNTHFLPPLALPPSGNIKPPLEPPAYL